MRLPKENYWKQLNIGDKFGDLWASYNLEISKKLGNLLVSPRMLLNINTDDDAQLDEPAAAFKTFTVSASDAVGVATMYLWAVAGDYLWNCRAGANTTFKQDATLNTPSYCNSDQSDLNVSNSKLYVTGASRDVKYLDSSGTWNTISNGLANSSGLHQMTFFRALNRLFIVDDNAAGISAINNTTPINVASSTQYTLNDLVEGSGVSIGSEISCIASNTNRIGIGTINRSGSNSKFYKWDGSSGGGGLYGANEELNLDASGALAVIVVDDVFIVFDTKGRLMQENGATFTELAKLPLEGALLKLPLTPMTRPVHYNGMTINEDGDIEILINTELWDTNGTIKENCPSGVWCYDRKNKNFYHKRSLGLTKSNGTITDYGQQKLSRVGALASVEVINSSITQGSINGRLLASATYYTTATVTKDGIFYDDTNDTLEKYGWFSTVWLFSSQIKETWQYINMLIKNLLNSTDKIYVKFKTRDYPSVDITGTWASSSTFNTETDLREYEGWEVNVLQGQGAGKCPSISSVTDNGASGWLVTLDDAYTNTPSGTFKARIEYWSKSKILSDQTDDTPSVSLLNLKSSFKIKIKVGMLFKGKNELYDIILSSKAQEKIE